MPQFECEQGPKAHRVVTFTPAILLNHGAYDSGLEVAALSQGPLRQEIIHHGVQIAAQPGADRSSKGRFSPLNDLARNHALDGAPEDVF